MAKKVLIDDIADVVNNHWPGPPEAFYMDDCGAAWGEPSEGGLFEFEGGKYKPIEPGVMVELRDFDFYFAWQGKGEEDRKGVPSGFVTLFNKIQKAKTYVTLVVEVPKEEEADLMDWLTNNGRVVR